MARIPDEYGDVIINLENCRIPKERLELTPSMRDGLDYKIEHQLRILCCENLQHSGLLLKLPQVAMANAQVLFQRYYCSKSFVVYDFQHVSIACLYLASKIEECYRKLRDIINVFHYVTQKKSGLSTEPLEYVGEYYFYIKNEVIKMERRILKELGFCVHVKHPHKIIVVYLKFLEMDQNRAFVQRSWNYMNDSLRTTVFLRYSPETIAAACIFLAARVLSIPLPKTPGWWEVFGCSIEEIEDISLYILELYQTKLPSPEEMKREVKKARETLEEKKSAEKHLIESSSNNSPCPPSPRHTQTTYKPQNSDDNTTKPSSGRKHYNETDRDISNRHDRAKHKRSPESSPSSGIHHKYKRRSSPLPRHRRSRSRSSSSSSPDGRYRSSSQERYYRSSRHLVRRSGKTKRDHYKN
ncbi:Cyclin-L1-like [Oopsacas minuta]|uniref:Cyclin-L1-like n=1 Tax=Oopsacas minuta TaxID=111878 RepID=A0AAV7KFB2_9METZ|nr:Cyclin-L1-like [Oopsacas minuta]